MTSPAKYDVGVSCPTCKSEEGEVCYAATGRPMYNVGHKTRASKAERAARTASQLALDFTKVIWS